MSRKSDYGKDMFRQLEEMMKRIDTLEVSHKKDSAKVNTLESIIRSQENEVNGLNKEVEVLNQKNQQLMIENAELKQRNELLEADNERMKRILNNNSQNSSCPPSSDQQRPSLKQDENDNDKKGGSDDEKPGKAPNMYNSRNKTTKKKGAQPGHKGKTLTRKTVEEKIKSGEFEHRIITIGDITKDYVKRYLLDLDIRVVATEIRIYADENKKFHIPKEYLSEVTYGSAIRAIASSLYSEGVMSNDRICAFINSISNDALEISEGSVYSFCRQFSKLCEPEIEKIKTDLLNGDVVCTDATYTTTNGFRTYIRNFSNDKSVYYIPTASKSLDTLKGIDILNTFTGILEHDHETALYHFGTDHAECNVHLERYLLKNTEETGNRWSHDLTMFLKGVNHYRKKCIRDGLTCMASEKLKRFEMRYDEIIEQGIEQQKTTKGKYAKREEKKLLKRLKKYKHNHLLFIYNFSVPYSDNMSERDLRKCKSRQKMAGGFRSMDGMKMYSSIMSVIETLKRRGYNVFHGIEAIFKGQSVLV